MQMSYSSLLLVLNSLAHTMARPKHGLTYPLLALVPTCRQLSFSMKSMRFLRGVRQVHLVTEEAEAEIVREVEKWRTV